MFIRLYLITLPVFFAIDMLWLGFVARGFYRTHIGSLLKTNVNWLAAITFYLLFIGGLVQFVIAPALAVGMWTYALQTGALFGVITYATYDLTNLATLKHWPLNVTIVDMIWGAVLSGSVAAIATALALSLHI